MSKQPLIEITTSSHGLDYVVHALAMERWLDVCDDSLPRDQAEQLRDIANERRVMLAEEFRSLARRLEAAAHPFSNYGTPDPLVSRGAAEREIDRLALHIKRLQDGGYLNVHHLDVDEREYQEAPKQLDFRSAHERAVRARAELTVVASSAVNHASYSLRGMHEADWESLARYAQAEAERSRALTAEVPHVR